MLRLGLAVWASLFLAGAAAAQTLYLQPGQHGVGAAASVVRVSGGAPWDEPAASAGASVTGTVHPGLDLTVQMAWPLADNSTEVRAVTGVVTGYLQNTETSKLGGFVGTTRVTSRYDRSSASFYSGGLIVALPRPLGAGLTAVPQFVAAVSLAEGGGGVSVAVSPAFHWALPEVRYVVEPSLGYLFGEEIVTMGVSAGIVFAF